MSEQWVDVVFVQGDEYNQIADMSIDEMAEYLAQWDYGHETDGAHTRDEQPWGNARRIELRSRRELRSALRIT